jgi:hypothetical protein
MTHLILSQLQSAKNQTDLPWRALCQPIAYSTLMRWRARARSGQPLLQSPGPKKSAPLNWKALYRQILQLHHGRVRTQGTTAMYHRHAQSISRRQLRQLAAQIRQDKYDSMKRIHWHFPGLAWGIDATEYQERWKLIPVSDLACRYRFVPLVALSEDGNQIALYLENLFRQHGPPLFLKPDNGSPFNCDAVERVLEQHCVLPLNNPPRYPRYNGATEKSIGDLKRHLDQRLHSQPWLNTPLLPQVEAAVHELNHRPRRGLKGRTPCDLFHDPNRRLSLSLKGRKRIFRLLLAQFAQTIGKMAPRNHREYSAAWRLSVETWLRCQGLISVRPNSKPNVSTIFPKIWSHN